MKIMIMSDSHFMEQSKIEKIMKSHSVDCYIHCGDIHYNFQPSNARNFYIVLGNNDYYPGHQELLVTIDNLVFFIVHGNRHDVNYTLDYLIETARNKHADVVCFGHTHIAYFDEVDDLTLINPGSLALPRGHYRKGTFAIFDTTERSCRYYNADDFQECNPFDHTNKSGFMGYLKSVFK
ncbi:MAG: metallophosphoesterase [Erysipelotrichaceae bacterium]|nr:metallophosphoesterase [Erysipelotrichaceae bacterium]MDD3809540.1 metallophosphoesterase [Erysipelotrichaceae bacterium]